MNDAPSVNGQTGAAASPALCPAPGTRAQHRKPPVKRCRRRHQPPRRPTRNPTHAEPPRCALSHQLIELGNARYFGVTELCTRTWGETVNRLPMSHRRLQRPQMSQQRMRTQLATRTRHHKPIQSDLLTHRIPLVMRLTQPRQHIPVSLNRQPRLTSNPQTPPHLTPSITQRPRRLRHRATRRKHHHRLRQLTTTGIARSATTRQPLLNRLWRVHNILDSSLKRLQHNLICRDCAFNGVSGLTR